MSEKEGWIALHRKIQECDLWEDKPYARGQAWVDLLLLANHNDKKVVFDGNIITVKKGQRITSIRILGERWGWSRTKVNKFLELLEREKMIIRASDTKKTLVTIVNYELYQDIQPKKSHRNATEMTQKSINNNDNNDNNENNNIPPLPPKGEKELCRVIPPTYEMVKEYCDSRNNGIDPGEFIDFYTSKGWVVGKGKMKDWQASIRTWERKRKEKMLKESKPQTVDRSSW